MKNKAVVLGSNYYIGLSIIRCLGVEGITVVAIDYSKKDTYGSDSKYCSEQMIAPHYREKTREFVDFLIDYASKQSHPPVLFPSADPYVEIIDEHLEELREVFLIPQTEQGLYTRTMHKEKLHKLAIEKGIMVPETVSIHDKDFLEKVEKTLKYPCIVKPVDSHTFVSIFRRKMFKVYNREELENAVFKAKKAGQEVIIQRIIPGFDDHMYTFDAYLNQDAKITHWTTCQKYRQYPINFGASVYTTQRYVPELYQLSANFLEGIRFKGFVEIEFKKDAETGQFYLIELNVRTTNFNQLLYKIGLNMPYITYRDLVGDPLKPKAIKKDTNTVFWYAYEDLLAVKDYIKTGQLSLKEVVLSYFKSKAYAIWDWKDPKPAFTFAKMIMKKIIRKIFTN